MYYFVGYNLGSSITGIEKAMINRLKIFKESGKKRSVYFYHGIDLFQSFRLNSWKNKTISICMIIFKKQLVL